MELQLYITEIALVYMKIEIKLVKSHSLGESRINDLYKALKKDRKNDSSAIARLSVFFLL